MITELESAHLERLEKFRGFVNEEIAPFADGFDKEERTPPSILEKLGRQGYLGATIPVEYGGLGLDMVTYGLLCHEMGRASASLLSLLTVHGMVSHVLAKWGTEEQRKRWLPRLAKGTTLGAFALTEPTIGSDARNIVSRAERAEGGYDLNGTKKWISYGQTAGLFIVFAQVESKPTAFLVERETKGLSVLPIGGMLGFRASMLAEIRFKDCRIPMDAAMGRVGMGVSHVGGYALDFGRYSIAWGATGLGQACLDACLEYSGNRSQGGSLLRDHQFIQGMIAEMIVNVKAAKLLCVRAGRLKDSGDPESIIETTIAKYFAARMIGRVANDAVQIHGANGCGEDFPIQRFFRDARIMEIIEGSTQIQQTVICGSRNDKSYRDDFF